MDKRYTLPIARIVKESKDVNTYYFNHSLKALPGQFIMMTMFDGGEKPFSVSDCSETEFCVTIKSIGEFTNRLSKLKAGDLVSFRGPYGTFFSCNNKSKMNLLLIGGGYGMAPVRFLAKQLKGHNLTLIAGAKNRDELIFIDEFQKMGIELFITTDDGTIGEKCTVIDKMIKIIRTRHFDKIYGCGPEVMLDKLIKNSEKIPAEVLIERYIKCGIGLCGQCILDPSGLRVCIEGPVVDKETALKFSDFGKYKRDASGKKHEITVKKL